MEVLRLANESAQLTSSLSAKRTNEGQLAFSLAEIGLGQEGAGLITGFKTWLMQPDEKHPLWLPAANGLYEVVSVTGRQCCAAYFSELYRLLRQKGREIRPETLIRIAEPAYHSDTKLAFQGALREALDSAVGFPVKIEFVREPDAVFEHYRTIDSSVDEIADLNVLVIDAGGGTCNISAVSMTRGGTVWKKASAPVAAEAPQAGGFRIDRRILTTALRKTPVFKQIQSTKDSNITHAYEEWLTRHAREAESVKLIASGGKHATAKVAIDGQFARLPGAPPFVVISADRNMLLDDVQTLWNAHGIGTAASSVLSQLETRLTRTAGRKNVEKDPKALVQLVLLAGGSSQLPGFRQRVESFFAPYKPRIVELGSTSALAVVSGMAASHRALARASQAIAADAGESAVFLPALEEDLVLHWVIDGGNQEAGVVFRADKSPLDYVDKSVDSIVAKLPTVKADKYRRGGQQVIAQVCLRSDATAKSGESPSRLNLLGSNRVISVPHAAAAITVHSSIELSEHHVPQLLLQFSVQGKTISEWRLPYLRTRTARRAATGETSTQGEDVLCIDFGTSTTRVIDVYSGVDDSTMPDRMILAPQPVAVPQVTESPPIFPVGVSADASPPVSTAAPPVEVPIMAMSPIDPPPSPTARVPAPLLARFDHPERPNFEGSEAEFLSYVRQYFINSGLELDSDIVTSIYLSIKVRPLVVLAGPPGVGKSSAASVFINALGGSLTPTGDSLRVAVEANWTDGRFLFWQRHESNRPVRTRFHDLLRLIDVRAPLRPHYVLFDEMNLAHVEYYFAQFLSAMEGDGCLSVPGAIDGENLIQLPAGESSAALGFFGTINVDETTHVLSDKVLDRCNLIEVPASAPPGVFKAKPKVAPSPALQVSVGQLTAWREGVPDIQLGDDLSRIWQALASRTTGSDDRRRSGMTIPLGRRVLQDIALFCHFAERVGMSRTEALDLQVRQRVLPKIRGDLRLTRALDALLLVVRDLKLAKSEARLTQILAHLEHEQFATFWA